MPDRANPALPPCSLAEGLRTTLEKASDWLMMKLANLPITINCFVFPTTRIPAQCVAACAWGQRMGTLVKISTDALSWAFITSTMTTGGSRVFLVLGQFKMFRIVLWSGVYIWRRNAVVVVKIWSEQASLPFLRGRRECHGWRCKFYWV